MKELVSDDLVEGEVVSSRPHLGELEGKWRRGGGGLEGVFGSTESCELGQQQLRGAQDSLLGGMVLEGRDVERDRSARSNVDVFGAAHRADFHIAAGTRGGYEVVAFLSGKKIIHRHHRRVYVEHS